MSFLLLVFLGGFAVALGVLALLVFLAGRGRSSSREPARDLPAAPAGAASSSLLPPVPEPPSPAYRLGPGIYMFGQLWRYDGRRWHAELGDDCEPVVAIFDAGELGTCAVTWDSVYRRPRPDAPWSREYQSPGGRPRLSLGWGHPRHGLFACGDRGLLLRSHGDGVWRREPLPPSIRSVVTAVWGDDEGLHVGTADGQVAWCAWAAPGEWRVEQTPIIERVVDGVVERRGLFLLDGVSTTHAVYAIAQSGEVLHRPASATGEAGWTIEKKLASTPHGLLADAAGRVWVSSRAQILRSDRPGQWISETVPTPDEICALATNGAVTWAAGSRSILLRRDGAARWTASPPGRSGTVTCLWVGTDGELLAGTDFMLEVDAGGTGKDVEIIASVRTAG